ncbi:MAG: hypothetical protein IH602_01765 [Bryobacteraceae bacterium]|nr:hypothetical protein [Bryobacteraceae bacterium]
MEFPLLKTGAVAQDGLEIGRRRLTRVLRYVDGSEQTVKVRRGQRRWTVRLTQLDEAELARVAEFVETLRGETGSFAFTDPRSGVRHEACRLEGSEFELRLVEMGGGRAELRIVEEAA